MPDSAACSSAITVPTSAAAVGDRSGAVVAGGGGDQVDRPRPAVDRAG